MKILKGMIFGLTMLASINIQAMNNNDDRIKPKTILPRDYNWYSSVCFSHDGQAIAIGDINGAIKLWSLESESLKVVASLAALSRVHSLSFSHDDTKLASSHEYEGRDSLPEWSSLRLWNPTEYNDEFKKFPDATYSVLCTCFSPDGQTLASTTVSQTILLRDLTLPYNSCDTLEGHESDVYSVCFSPNGELLASGDEDGIIKIWHVANRECLATLKGHEDIVRSLDFSPDGEILASGSDDGEVALWNIQDYSLIQTFGGFPNHYGHKDHVYCVRFCPNRNIKVLATGLSNKTIELHIPKGEWLTANDFNLYFLEGHTKEVSSISFSPDGKKLASASSEVLLWDLEEFYKTLSK